MRICRSCHRGGGTWLRAVLVVGLLFFAFYLLQHPARTAELRMDAEVLRLAGFHGVALVSGTYVYLVPVHQPALLVELAPSCSSLASVLTLGSLAGILPRAYWHRGRALVAVVVAGSAVVLGNLVRIDSSIVAGLLLGRFALVLFHNTAGDVFGFAYTLGGFLLMLFLLLPRTSARQAEGGVGTAAAAMAQLGRA
ncbi:MAG: hypothetical protein ACP5VR_09875 [Acidimicrobiales bacterium]